jgi:type I restriction enzyme S subunit
MKSKRLGDIVNFKRGYDLPYSERTDGIYPVISSSGISGSHSEFKVEGEGVIIGRYGTLGQPYYVKGKYWPHNTTLYITDFKKNNPKYIYYLLKCLGNLQTSDKSTVPGINRNDLHEIIIPCVEIENQSQIAHVLSDLDSKIELNNKINSELEAMAKLIYDYWFVQFEFPFDFAQDKPKADIRPYKSSGGKMVWNEELKREIPEGWSNATLLNNSFTTIIKPGIEEFSEKKRYLATADVNDNDIGLGSEITYTERESRANMQPIKNSIWFAKMKNSRKHIFIGQKSNDIISKNILSTGFMGLSCNENAFEYLASYVTSDVFEITKDIVSHGATMQGIGNDDLKFFKIIVPDIDIIANYKKLTSVIYEKIELNRIENQEITELRDWLLPMLMNGQVRVN